MRSLVNGWLGALPVSSFGKGGLAKWTAFAKT
jgi:hypothetical protein